MVLDEVKLCVECQSKRFMQTKPTITPILAKNPRDIYIANLVDIKAYKHLDNGYGWLLVMVDCFSKFSVVRIIKNKSAYVVSKEFRNIFFTIGPPVILHIDNGLEFKNNSMKVLCEEMEVRQVHGRPRAPWIQGQVERLNQSIKRWISSTSHSKGVMGRIVNCIYKIVYFYNKTVHSTTNRIPFLLFMGVKSTGDLSINHIESLLEFNDELEILEDERNTPYVNNLNAADKMILNRKWKFDEEIISVGDNVLMKNDTDINPKLKKHPLYDHVNTNKYVVLNIIDDLYNIVDENGCEHKNIRKLRLKRLNK